MDPEQDLELERAADYRTYAVTGTHREIGRAMGQQFPVAGLPGLVLSSEHVAFARRSLEVLRQTYPPLAEEVEGYAEGAGRGFEDVAFHLLVGLGGVLDNRCSSVGVLTADGPVVARNYDFSYFEDRRHLVTTRAGGALAHNGMWTGLIGGRYDGANECGLWVSIHGGGGRRPRDVRPGLAFHLVARAVLETCRTAREAAEWICGVPHIASYNYFLADPEEMLVVEAHPERCRVRGPEDGVLVCTNHPVHPEMRDLEATAIGANSRRRYAFLMEAARRCRSAPDPRAELAAAMRDHSVPVCGHRDGLATFWSAWCAPRLRQLAYALGAPCRNEYGDVPWPEGKQDPAPPAVR